MALLRSSVFVAALCCSLAVTCAPGTYYRKYGPSCGLDCCTCVPGNWCPGTVNGYEKMNACPAGDCSPAGASAESQCAPPACAAPPAASGVEQVHISVTGVPGEMHISFVSDAPCSQPLRVAYGPTPDVALNASAAGAMLRTDMAAPICIFGVTLAGLAQGGTTFYRIDGSNETFSFPVAPSRPGGNVYLVMGDYGTANNIAQQQLEEEGAARAWDAIIYSGDMAYNLETDGGLVGNAFMNVLQPYASRIPFMAVVGNHERASDFAQFKARFAGYNLTAAASTSSSPLWYSYNHGLLHVVNIDTEVFSYGTAAEVQAQYDWLYRDVHAINRAVTPWVVANGHKTRFMKGTDFSRLDTIFKTIGVDLYVAGHAHNYQRIAPNDNGVREDCATADRSAYVDCANYVAVVSGSPGNFEIQDHPDNAKAPADVLDSYNQNYGFSHLIAANATTLVFEFEEVKVRDPATGALVAKKGAFTDRFVITKSGNGRRVPTHTAFDFDLPLVGEEEL